MSDFIAKPVVKPTLSTAEVQDRFDQRIRDLFEFWRTQESALVVPEIESRDSAIRALAAVCKAKQDFATSWLALVAISGALPNEDECRDFHGIVSLENDSGIRSILLAATRTALRTERPASKIQFVPNQICIDVDFACQTDFTTGIQRVTRSIVTAWTKRSHPFLLVRWTSDHAYLQPLSSEESTRMGTPVSYSEFEEVMVVPVNSTLFVPEVGNPTACEALGALARHSGNHVVGIAYDLIPVTSARYVAGAETQKFVAYLSAIKYFEKLIAISDSAAIEFHGFNQMLASQGLVGPAIVVESLPAQAISKHKASALQTPPLVLCVGTLEGRKNQRRILAAAERAWRKGAQFQLVFVGHASFESAGGLLSELAELQASGRLVRVVHGLRDDELAELYEAATSTIFISSHEGFGLPVAESVAHDTPVIATDFGSIAQLAKRGSHILVNPTDVVAISSAILSTLRGESAPADESHRHDSSDWDEYGARLWSVINGA